MVFEIYYLLLATFFLLYYITPLDVLTEKLEAKSKWQEALKAIFSLRQI